MSPITVTRTATPTIILTTTKTVKEPKESKKLFIHPVRHVGRLATPQRKANMELTPPTDRLPGTEDREDRIKSKREPTQMIRRKLLSLQTKI